MIFNIIDRRDLPHRWQQVSAIIEPIWQDNGVKNGDHYVADEAERRRANSYLEMPITSVALAVEACSELGYPCTLFLYDVGKGISTEFSKAGTVSANI